MQLALYERTVKIDRYAVGLSGNASNDSLVSVPLQTIVILNIAL